ncbi:MAG TPA: cell division protein CrgA [Jatrophihabitans sp.]
MPKSKVRKKSDSPSRPDALAGSSHANRAMAPSPSWYPITMVVVMVLGLAYLVVYYLTNSGQGVPIMQDLGAWNFAVGFGVMMLGLIMAVRWR